MEFDSQDTIEVDGIEIGPGMTQEQAERLYALGEEVSVFVMMVLAKKLAVETATSTDAPATPSAAKPPYEKENKQAGKKGRKKPGAKPGHSGCHRDKPDRIDRHEERRAKECPDCGNKRLRRRKKKRKRIIIDLPEGFRAEAVEITIFADYCTRCKKEVEPKVAEAMPGCTLGNRIVAFSVWLHYCLGTTIGQLVSIFGFHIKTTISEGGLVTIRHRLAAVLEPWYEQIKREAIRLWQRREEYSAETYASRRSRITIRLDALIADDWANKNATRLVKRLRKYHDHLFTFLELPYVPFENNFAEREIRPAVIMRKNSYCNRSDKGADTQAILMTVFRTLKQRNLNPVDTVVQALREYNLTGALPPLPSKKT